MFKKYFFDLSLKIGIAGAIGQCLYFFVFYMMDTPACDQVYLFDFWIPSIFIALILKFFRDKLNNGALRFWQGLTLGVQVLFWCCLLSSIILFVYVTFIDFSFFEQCMDNFLASHLANKEEFIKQLNAESYAKTTEEIKNISVLSLIIQKFILNFFSNLITIIFFSVLFRR